MALKSIERFFLTLDVDMHSMTVTQIRDGKESKTYDVSQYFQYFVEYGVRKADVAQLQEHFSIDYFQNMIVTGKTSEVFEFCVQFVGEDYKILKCKMKPVESQNNSVVRVTLEDISHKRVQKLVYIKNHFTQYYRKSYVKPFDINFEEKKNNNIEKKRNYKCAIIIVSILCTIMSVVFFNIAYTQSINKQINETLDNCKSSSLSFESKLNDIHFSLLVFRDLLSGVQKEFTKTELINYVEQGEKDYAYEGIIFIDENNEIICTDNPIKYGNKSYLSSVLVSSKLQNYEIKPNYLEGNTLINYILPAKELIIQDVNCKAIVVIFDLNKISNSVFTSKNQIRSYDTMLINKDGTILWSGSPHLSKIINKGNFLDYLNSSSIRITSDNTNEDLKLNLARKKSGTLNFTIDGKRKFVAYEPLQVEGLYFVNLSKTKKLDFYQINIMIFIIFILCMILSIPIMALLYKIKRINEEKIKLEEIAYCDEVTEGMNSNYFDNKAENIIHDMECHYALVISNLRNFSLYNARYGNVRGDEIIRKLFLGVSKYIDNDELVCRAYAEHMLILMKYEGEKQLEERLDNIGQCIIDTSFKLEFGVCVIRDLTMELETAKQRANMALKNEAKKYKNNVTIAYYDVKLLEKILFEKEVENTMYRAFRKGEFKIFVEPRYDLKTRALCNGDVYAVWNHPEKGAIMPERYIDIFVRKGLIMCLDSFIFEEVCKKIKEHLEKGRNRVNITINLHRNHFSVVNFFNKFRKIKDIYDIPGECISFEISEEIICEKILQIDRVIDEIHKMGSTCIMSEYKGRYLGLEALCKLRIDTIKFDSGFITKKLPDEMIIAMIDIAKAAKIKTIMTAVSKPSQVLYLSKADCDEAKGDVFAKNISLEEYINIF